MLILTRTTNESIVIQTSDGEIEVIVLGVNKGQVKVGFKAPDNVDIWRSELLDDSAA